MFKMSNDMEKRFLKPSEAFMFVMDHIKNHKEHEQLIYKMFKNNVPLQHILDFIARSGQTSPQKSEPVLGRGIPLGRDEFINSLKIQDLASDLQLKLVKDETKGWGLKADTNFKQGTIILVDKPFLTANINEDACDHCGKTVKFKIFCDKCKYEKYCSKECKSLAFEKFHKFLCGCNPEDLISKGRKGVSASAKMGLAYYKMIGMAMVQNKQSVFDLDWVGQLGGFSTVNMSRGPIVNHLNSIINALESGGR
jgi:hypothetical protein